MLIVVLGGSLAVVGYPAAGAPRRPVAGGTRPDQAGPHRAQPATASGAKVNDPPGTGASSEWARTHSSHPRPTSADPTPPASQDPQSQDPPPSAAPSASAGRPTASAPAPQSQPPSPHPSTGRAGGQPGTPRAVTPRPSEASPPPDDAPRLRQRPRVPTVQSIEPEAIPSDAGVLPAPAPATPPADPSGEAAALPVDNPTSGGPAAMDQPLTLISSGLFGLVIAVTGMAMVVRRRRQW